MSDDLVERLRALKVYDSGLGEDPFHPKIATEAADEIERLRQGCEKWCQEQMLAAIPSAEKIMATMGRIRVPLVDDWSTPPSTGVPKSRRRWWQRRRR